MDLSTCRRLLIILAIELIVCSTSVNCLPEMVLSWDSFDEANELKVSNLSICGLRPGWGSNQDHQDYQDFQDGYIIAGGKASLKQFPSFVNLRYDCKPADKPSLDCSGVIVGPDVVLTAAQCIKSGYGGLYIHAGIVEKDLSKMKRCHELESNNSDQYQVIKAETACLSPENYWRGSRIPYMDDLAVIKLNGTFKFNDYVQPACLAHEKSRILEPFYWPTPNETFIQTGWGFNFYLSKELDKMDYQKRIEMRELMMSDSCMVREYDPTNLRYDFLKRGPNDKIDNLLYLRPDLFQRGLQDIGSPHYYLRNVDGQERMFVGGLTITSLGEPYFEYKRTLTIEHMQSKAYNIQWVLKNFGYCSYSTGFV